LNVLPAFLGVEHTAGAEPLLAALQQRPGFRNDAVIEAMGCTENRDFFCWERCR
jgi:hypothetical protein